MWTDRYILHNVLVQVLGQIKLEPDFNCNKLFVEMTVRLSVCKVGLKKKCLFVNKIDDVFLRNSENTEHYTVHNKIQCLII